MTDTISAKTQNPMVSDPLPSWKDGAAKQSILDFVRRVTTEGSPDFVPVPERIAVFDNDGTLWPENPIPFQLAFVVDELKRRVPNEPKLAADAMVQAALVGDLAKLMAGEHFDGLLRVAALTHAGMTTDEFGATVETWLASATHPRYGKPYDQVIYEPMQELLRYLRTNAFKTFIVSGGGADFMRVWVERVYGIPPEQVVGSTGRTTFELRGSGPALVKTLDHLFVDDKVGKPVGIHQFIGRRPIACFGNSDGDQAMLQFTTVQNQRSSFGLIVHHNDAEREYAYDAKPKSTGQLVDALKEAPQRGWTVVSMKDDWNRLFAFEQNAVTAIDILLEPDALMIQHAEAVNARLLKHFPKGFSLDATHRPHITIVQRFVRTADLDRVYAATEKVLANENPGRWILTAFKQYFISAGPIGVAGIVVYPTAELVRLQRALLDAVAPFIVETGTAAAFVTTPDDPEINPAGIDYIVTFIPKASGKNFNPHVSTGVGTVEDLNAMVAEPFEAFTFSPVAASVYHLGNMGTARKKLKTWEFKSHVVAQHS